MSTRQVLSANLRALMAKEDHERAEGRKARGGLDTFKKITAASQGRLSNGKLDRIRQAKSATDIGSLDDLAEVFGVQPWHLLVPNLNPEELPQLAGADLLKAIRALVINESSQPQQPPSEPARPSGTKKLPGRLPGEVVRTGPGSRKSGEVSKPGSVPRKRGRGSA